MSEKPQVRWFDLATAGSDDLALAVMWTKIVSDIPGLPDGDGKLLAKASDRLTRIVMQEIGRVAFEESLDWAADHINEVCKMAEKLARGDDAGDGA